MPKELTNTPFSTMNAINLDITIGKFHVAAWEMSLKPQESLWHFVFSETERKSTAGMPVFRMKLTKGFSKPVKVSELDSQTSLLGKRMKPTNMPSEVKQSIWVFLTETA